MMNYHVGSWMASWDRKGREGTTKAIGIKCGLHLIVSLLIHFHPF